MLTAIDEIANQNHLQMIKAAVPYLPGPGQRLVGVYAKMMELQNVIRFFHQAPPGLSAQSAPAQSGGLPDMLNELRAFASPAEQEWIDQCINTITALQLCAELSRPPQGG